MKSLKWKREKSIKSTTLPTAREGHTITYISKHEKILLFGGLSNQRMNDLFLYDVKSNLWQTQNSTGRCPSSRCYHRTFYDEDFDCVFVHAGQGDKGRSLGDFYFLSLKNWVWKRLFILEMPTSRHHHTLTLRGQNQKEQIIFGGINLPENITLNDVWSFNYSNISFNSSLPDISGAKCIIRHCKGEVPSPRRGHSAFSVDRQLFIYGGRAQDNDLEDTSQIYALNYDTWIWKKINTIGKGPSPRSFFTCTEFTNNQILFFGGQENATNKVNNDVYILHLDDVYWSAPFTAGNKATPRYHHDSCLVQTKTDETFLVVIGGLDYTFCPMDINILYESEISENSEWEKLKEPTELDRLTSEKAGLTILDYKQYIHQLEEEIATERFKAVELEKEGKNLEQQMIKAEEDNGKQKGAIEKQVLDLEAENQKLLQYTETLFVLIKHEELITKEYQNKNKLLELTLQKIQDYMMTIDQFYSAILKNKWDDNDQKESSLKKIVESTKEEVIKSKDLHKESLYKLKKAYEKLVIFLSKSDQDVDICKKIILNINKQYEQILCDTEADENANQ